MSIAAYELNEVLLYALNTIKREVAVCDKIRDLDPDGNWCGPAEANVVCSAGIADNGDRLAAKGLNPGGLPAEDCLGDIFVKPPVGYNLDRVWRQAVVVFKVGIVLVS